MITAQKKRKKYFKQFQSLTMITQLELGITDAVSVSLVSTWHCQAVRLSQVVYCNNQVHRYFFITLY
jgi:hypothetical protein